MVEGEQGSAAAEGEMIMAVDGEEGMSSGEGHGARLDSRGNALRRFSERILGVGGLKAR